MGKTRRWAQKQFPTENDSNQQHAIVDVPSWRQRMKTSADHQQWMGQCAVSDKSPIQCNIFCLDVIQQSGGSVAYQTKRDVDMDGFPTDCHRYGTVEQSEAQWSSMDLSGTHHTSETAAHTISSLFRFSFLFHLSNVYFVVVLVLPLPRLLLPHAHTHHTHRPTHPYRYVIECLVYVFIIIIINTST